ncbi:NifB/NifX family molybdenum-iron cluster-binding protein [Massilibacteroides sp.]|uniref:NifB/NifX family molybdenum-iron cluster-binding protein n=1 Tax=Massilibacteroides sp. TaxID=2034766 RepID=UPI002610B3F4|nr:NifB/NifX family molybdenum-iron cluster-binding protein [Massilibacteroides sp.]MDD4516169.1 NifB/NifX family molybdenum-iron cluster-binding protein [Massilibacteroides sp.]
MKIAVPTKESKVDDHFGHCESYTIYTIEDNSIKGTESLPSPQGCGCKSNIASVLQEKGITVMLAGSMGNGALNVLSNHGIKVYRGCSGGTKELVLDFLSGKINDSGEACSAHEDGHVCNH